MSALVDASFAGAGVAPGLELWRIEAKCPVKLTEVRTKRLKGIQFLPLLLLRKDRYHGCADTLSARCYVVLGGDY